MSCWQLLHSWHALGGCIVLSAKSTFSSLHSLHTPTQTARFVSLNAHGLHVLHPIFRDSALLTQKPAVEQYTSSSPTAQLISAGAPNGVSVPLSVATL